MSHMYMTPVVVWQKQIQHCKEIILQLKINIKMLRTCNPNKLIFGLPTKSRIKFPL